MTGASSWVTRQAAIGTGRPEPVDVTDRYQVEGSGGMAKLTVDSYEQMLRASGLVEPARLDKLLEEIRGQYGSKADDSEFLAERLIEAHILTLWQNQVLVEGRQDTLLGGRHKGFFLGSYKLLAHLGTGGMNSVFLAEHTVMRRRVAIKVLPISGDRDAVFLERFRQESRAIAALDHPNIVRAHDFNNDADVYYLVMEFIDGKDLHHLVKERGPLPFRQAADFIRQASEGLAHAHRAGLVHRDIKPANLLVDRKRVVKLLDLGIARLDCEDEAESAIRCDSSAGILGTADYLAPEQALDSHGVDARADIYSLGCTLYFLLTGHPPFQKGTLAQRMVAHQMQEPPSIFEDRPSAPGGLVEICQRMMAKKPEDRFQTAEEVSEALQTWTETFQREGEDEQIPGVGRLAQSDTASGLGPSTTIGAGRKKKRPKASVSADEKISCRTCGTEFSRYMYRSKCPKCGTLNHPLAASMAYSSVDYIQEEPSPASPAPVPEGELQADPNVKASCPSCGETFHARWTKCIACGAATILHKNPGDTDAGQPDGSASSLAIQLGVAEPSPYGSGYISYPTTTSSETSVAEQRDQFAEADAGAPTQPHTSQRARERASDAMGSSARLARPDASPASQHTQPADLSHHGGQPTGSQRRSDKPAEGVSHEGKKKRSKNREHRQRGEPSLHGTNSTRPGGRSAGTKSRSRSAKSKSKRGNSRLLVGWLTSKVVVGVLTIALVLGLGIAAVGVSPLLLSTSPGGPPTLKKYPDGWPQLQGQWQNQQQHGKWVAWYPTHHKQWVGIFADGRRHGHWEYWNDLGQRVFEGEYHHGQPQGQCVFRYDDGQLSCVGSYDSGKRHGKWTFWHPTGHKLAQGNYEAGRQVGKWTQWNDKGELTSTQQADSAPIPLPEGISQLPERPSVDDLLPRKS